MIVFDPSFYDPNKAVKIDPKTGNVIPGSGDPYNGMVIPGSGFPSSAKGRFPEATDPSLQYLFRGVNSHYSDIQWNDFQPRVGLAYQLNDKTVVRAGGGRFITRLGVSDSVFLGGNPPFQPNASVSFGSVDNPGGSGVAAVDLLIDRFLPYTTKSRLPAHPRLISLYLKAPFVWRFLGKQFFAVARKTGEAARETEQKPATTHAAGRVA